MCLVLLYLPFDFAYYVVGHNEHRTFVETRRPTELIAIQEIPVLVRRHDVLHPTISLVAGRDVLSLHHGSTPPQPARNLLDDVKNGV